jgi:uncharacterized OsmC-like protein
MKTTTIESPLNGINAAAQAATIDAIRQQPALGSVRFSAATHWTGGTRTTTEASSFEAAGSTHRRANTHITSSDMPLPFLGCDEAAAPTEIALHALAACLTSTLVYHCTIRGFTVRSVSTKIEASLDACGFLRIDDSTDSGFTDVRVSLDADTDAPEAELQDIIDHAPTLDVFTRSIPVQAIVHSAA